MDDHGIINELEQHLPGERALGQSDSKWFQRAHSVDVLNILPDDSHEGRIEKARQLLSRLLEIKGLVIQPAFQRMEAQMFERLRQICDAEIWQALAQGDQNRILALRAERNGIMLFFQQFADVSSDIEQLLASYPEFQDDPEKRKDAENQENP